MMRRFVYAVALALVGPLMAVAVNQAPRPMAGQALTESDTTSRALATVWAESMLPMLERSYAGDSLSFEAYLEGIQQAFDTDPSRQAYYRGILEGLQLIERVGTMQQMGLEVNLNRFRSDLLAALRGVNVGFESGEQANAYLNRIVAGKVKADTVSLADEQRFLDKQFKREGVVKFGNGLLFEVIREGEGSYPAPNDTVTVMYTGRLSDGTVFDETEEPISFPVDGVVEGMSEGLLHMKPGGRYRLFIPSTLGYGPDGIPGVIPGNSVLDFTLDLVGVKPAEQ